MSNKRKRKRPDKIQTHTKKIHKERDSCFILKDLIANYYPQVLSLREYILSKLSPKSKSKRLKAWSAAINKNDEDETKMASFLDHTWIGVDRYTVPQEEKWKLWNTFCQISNDSIAFFESDETKSFQSKIVDFAIWLLLSKIYNSFRRSKHLLCQGYNKRMIIDSIAQKQIFPLRSDIGYHNYHVTSMKASPWPQVLTYLGKRKEKAMLDLILDCGIFIPMDELNRNYYQLCGFPLGNIDIIPETGISIEENKLNQEKSPRTASLIKIVRNRIMYGRCELDASGNIIFGLKRHHVLNRYPISYDKKKNEFVADRNTVHILMYIFPRSFGLHNVFINDRNSLKTNQPLRDYTFREEEINTKYPSSETLKIPKRLRGKVLELIRKLQILHKRCPYKKLLEYYCPASEFQQTETEKSPITISLKDELISNTKKTLHHPSIVDYATPEFMVFAFCRGVLSRLIPREFWGNGDTLTHNRKIFLRNVNQFILNVGWLGNISDSTKKLCQSDTCKRLEIFCQFIYYMFDSILIPLIQTNFYVTESSNHRNRLFYFRHDIWKLATEAALSSLKSNLFEEVEMKQVKGLLDSRALGYSQLRLLPKGTTVRPIMNLRRKMSNKGYKGALGRSINTILTPVHNILTLEKASRALLRTHKLTNFCRTQIQAVLVDVHAAFDTIPQSAVLKLISSVTTKDKYRISRYVEIKSAKDCHLEFRIKPVKRWKTSAFFPDDYSSFEENLKKKLAHGKIGSIFVENIVDKIHSRSELLNLLTQHIKHNIVKIRNRYYRQKEGIPQGSVISSLLCNYFYADLEANHLSFLRLGESLLLRLTDDFLLVTTNISHARQFLKIMHEGLPSYGLKVNPLKTLVNFDVSINGNNLSIVQEKMLFPFCGCFIDMNTLDISRDRIRWENIRTIDSLTVEHSNIPGKSFQRRILNSFKLQMHAMFLDPVHNSLSTVLNNLHSAYVETACKTHAYLSCLPSCKRPGLKLLTITFETLVQIGETLIKRRIRDFLSKNNDQIRPKDESCFRGLGNIIGRNAMNWLALIAFEQVFRKKQTLYRSFLNWLDINKKILYNKQGNGLKRIIQEMKKEKKKSLVGDKEGKNVKLNAKLAKTA
ncbi:Telomerase reverse transcriptase [Erysiphe neolycopersici]|uniref:Telomerase reverse transcriptase n=1 Tax=Erysiphe neolycopersici TaxID=212602 RepID=A0A420HCP7_9PEZI|nr:Telomerase reverse transcriptase [Erysiphe neolycopersici]